MASADPTVKEDEMQEGTTIVVKDTRTNEHWTRPSSPESSPEVEPPVGNLLTSVNGPQNHLQHLESPEPDDPEDDEVFAEQAVKEDGDAKPVSFRDDDRMPLAGTSEERLLQMPELRPLPWREGVDPSSENLVGGDSRRKQIKFGCLLATRGEVQKMPCSTCLNGRGKFALCIALEGFFKGACASCQLSGGPNRCSIKQNDGEDGSPVGRPPDKNRKSSSNSVKRPSSREGSQPSQVKKRRKTDGGEAVTEKDSPQILHQPEQYPSHSSTPVVQSPWATPQNPPSVLPPVTIAPTLVPSQQALSIAGLSGLGSNGYRSSVYNHPPSPAPPLERHASSGNSPRPAPARRISSGWATVNKPPTPQGEDTHPLKIHHSHYMPKTQPLQAPPPPAPLSHAPSSYAPPPPQHYLPQPLHHQSPYSMPPNNYQQPPPPPPHNQPPYFPPPLQQHPPFPPAPPQHYSPYTMPPPTQQSTTNNGLPSHSTPQPPPLNSPNNANGGKPPLINLTRKEQPAAYSGTGPYIDSLPPAKQRQLYGIVTGIQVGIKHLQSELEVLKKALGMEETPAGTGLR